MNEDHIPMTRDEYDGLKAKIDHLQSVTMIEVTKRIAAARALGDLSENAEYHAAREDQGMLQARIDSLNDSLSRAMIIDKTTLPTDVIVFGACIPGVRRRYAEAEARRLQAEALRHG